MSLELVPLSVAMVCCDSYSQLYRQTWWIVALELHTQYTIVFCDEIHKLKGNTNSRRLALGRFISINQYHLWIIEFLKFVEWLQHDILPLFCYIQIIFTTPLDGLVNRLVCLLNNRISSSSSVYVGTNSYSWYFADEYDVTTFKTKRILSAYYGIGLLASDIQESRITSLNSNENKYVWECRYRLHFNTYIGVRVILHWRSTIYVWLCSLHCYIYRKANSDATSLVNRIDFQKKKQQC